MTKTSVEISDPFDLSKFSTAGDNIDKKIRAAEDYLKNICNPLDLENVAAASNPIKLNSSIVEWPSINSHGELEFWITDQYKKLYDWKTDIGKGVFRSRRIIPKGVILCIDTQDRLHNYRTRDLPNFFLAPMTVYGNIRLARNAQRYVPGWQPHFIEIGALSYHELGNTWSFGVYGKGFNGTSRAEE